MAQIEAYFHLGSLDDITYVADVSRDGFADVEFVSATDGHGNLITDENSALAIVRADMGDMGLALYERKLDDAIVSAADAACDDADDHHDAEHDAQRDGDY